MSVNISNPSGGGITVETDPTALKLTGGTVTGEIEITSNGGTYGLRLVPSEAGNSYIGVYNTPDNAFVNISPNSIQSGVGSSYTSLHYGGITFPDGSTQTTAASGGGGGSSFMVGGSGVGLFSNSVKLETGGSYNGSVELTNEVGISMKMIVDAADAYGQIQVGLDGCTYDSQATFKFGYWSDLASYGWRTNQPIIFPDGTVQNTAYTGGGGSGGSSFSVAGTASDGWESTVRLDATVTNGQYPAGTTLGEVTVTHAVIPQNTTDHVKIACYDIDGYGYRKVGIEGSTVINNDVMTSSIRFGWHQDANGGNGQYGWKIDQPLIFPDGTVQYSAYTGGGGSGGGVDISQRYADAIAAAFGSCQFNQVYSAGVAAIQGSWVWQSAMNNQSLYYEFPAFIANIGYAGSCFWSILAPDGTEFYADYIDYIGFITVSTNQSPQDGYIKVRVTNSFTSVVSESFPITYIWTM